MPDYSHGKIYKITHPDCAEYYIGSTAMPKLSQRLAGHRQQAKIHHNHFAPFVKAGLEKMAIELLEKVACTSKAELNKRENEYIQKHMTDDKCINKKYSITVDKENYLDAMKHVEEKLEKTVKKTGQPTTKIITKEILIGGVLRKVNLRVVPEDQIPTYENVDKKYSRKHGIEGKFQFKLNPDKTLTETTLQLYHTWLSRITKHLGYSTEDDLIKHSTEIVDWMNANLQSTYMKTQTLAAIFYALNRPKYTNDVRMPYVKAFCACKIESVTNNKKLDDDKRKKLLEKLNSDMADYDNPNFKYTPA